MGLTYMIEIKQRRPARKNPSPKSQSMLFIFRLRMLFSLSPTLFGWYYKSTNKHYYNKHNRCGQNQITETGITFTSN